MYLSPNLGKLQNLKVKKRVLGNSSKFSLGFPPWPKISVVIPSFNQASYLRQTIKSVLDQKYPNLELIVIDGGSTDGTASILKDFESKLHYSVTEPDHGQAHAINKGMQRATGDIFAYLNSDDFLLPGSLFLVGNYLKENRSVGAVYGNRVLVDEKGRESGQWVLPPHSSTVMLYRDFVPQETLFWRKESWVKTGAHLDLDLHYCLDWDFICRLIQKKVKIVRIPFFLGAFRIHKEQKSLSKVVAWETESNQIHLKYLGYIPQKSEVRRKILTYLLLARFKQWLWENGAGLS